MEKKLTFGDIEIEKEIYRHKSHTFLKDIDIEKALVSNKISSGEQNFRYLIVYLYNDHKLKQIQSMLPKTSIYVQN